MPEERKKSHHRGSFRKTTWDLVAVFNMHICY